MFLYNKVGSYSVKVVIIFKQGFGNALNDHIEWSKSKVLERGTGECANSTNMKEFVLICYGCKGWKITMGLKGDWQFAEFIVNQWKSCYSMPKPQNDHIRSAAIYKKKNVRRVAISRRLIEETYKNFQTINNA